MLTVIEQDETFEQFLKREASASNFTQTGLRFRWLGQAGFYGKLGQTCFAIDPYLSDSLAEKYRGQHFPHVRMCQPPVPPEQLNTLDFVFCTHAHSDHLDPGTLPVLAAKNPSAHFIIPRSAMSKARERGVPEAQMITVNAGEVVSLTSEIRLTVIASAHETLQQDEHGNEKFLGYILQYTPRAASESRSAESHAEANCRAICSNEMKSDRHAMTLYHGGDGVWYPELSEILRSHQIDVAMLPVNGRDAFRAAHGVPGNFTFDESAKLCLESRIPILVPDHFGMFDFNTLDEETLALKIRQYSSVLKCVRLYDDRTYLICRENILFAVENHR